VGHFALHPWEELAILSASSMTFPDLLGFILLPENPRLSQNLRLLLQKLPLKEGIFSVFVRTTEGNINRQTLTTTAHSMVSPDNLLYRILLSKTVFLSVATVPSWTSPAVCYLIKTYHIICGGRLFALPPAFSTYDPPNDTPPKPLLSYLRARSHLSPISESSARKSSFTTTSPIEESSIRILRKGSC
jgi:hypothetical protein